MTQQVCELEDCEAPADVVFLSSLCSCERFICTEHVPHLRVALQIIDSIKGAKYQCETCSSEQDAQEHGYHIIELGGN